jgi:hypothetical protein
LKAECDFGRAGKITLTEHFENEKLSCLKTNDVDTVAASDKRYLNITVDYFNTLCPRSSYTLTFH